MRRYAFRLETVRRVRRVQETVAKAELARANGDVASAIAAVEARIETYEKKVIEPLASLSGPGNIVRVDAFMKRRYFNDLSGHAIVAARSSLAAAQLELEAKHALYSDAAKKVKALDRLDDRRREEYVVEYNRAVESEVDDIVTGRFSRGEIA